MFNIGFRYFLPRASHLQRVIYACLRLTYLGLGCLCLNFSAGVANAGAFSPSIDAPIKYVSADTWNEYRDIRLKNNKGFNETEDLAKPLPVNRSAPGENSTLQVVAPKASQSYLSDHVDAVDCPAERTEGNGVWSWYLCNLKIANEPYLSPYGIDMPMSFMTPVSKFFSSARPSRIIVFMHPDENGDGRYEIGRAHV